MQVSGSIALVVRGDCNFTTKAEVAQAGGAAGLIVINDDEGSFIPDDMLCDFM